MSDMECTLSIVIQRWRLERILPGMREGVCLVILSAPKNQVERDNAWNLSILLGRLILRFAQNDLAPFHTCTKHSHVTSSMRAALPRRRRAAFRGEPRR